MKKYPPVVIVDENDKPVGLAMLKEAWEKGLYYRTTLIMAEDGKSNVLLQKRSPNMELFPGRWEVSAAGHVDEGFDYDSAALREVEEEIGIKDAELEEMGRIFTDKVFKGRIMKHFSKVYRITLEGDYVSPDTHEVSELRWFSIADLKKMVDEHPDQVTDVLEQVTRRYY